MESRKVFRSSVGVVRGFGPFVYSCAGMLLYIILIYSDGRRIIWLFACHQILSFDFYFIIIFLAVLVKQDFLISFQKPIYEINNE